MRRASDADFVREKGARSRLAMQRRANIGSPCGDLGYTPLMYPTGFSLPHGGKPASISLCDRCTSPALPLHFPAINYRNAGAIRCWPSIPSTVSRGFDEF